MSKYFFRQCQDTQYPYVIQPGDTLYKVRKEFNVSFESILGANPGIDPDHLAAGERICIPLARPSDYSDTIRAMQRDIDILKEENSIQKDQESNYGNSSLKTRAIKVTPQELQFDTPPVAFMQDYSGHFTPGQSYPYYHGGSGGQRSVTVKDNFNVWHSFEYYMPITQ